MRQDAGRFHDYQNALRAGLGTALTLAAQAHAADGFIRTARRVRRGVQPGGSARTIATWAAAGT